MGCLSFAPPHTQRSLDPTPGLLVPLDLLVVQTCSPTGWAEAQGGRERTGILERPFWNVPFSRTIVGGSKHSWDWGSKMILLRV